MKSCKIRAIIAVMCLISIILCSCSFNNSIGKTDDRNQKWAQDIELLKRELPRKHKNMFYKLNEDDFNKQIMTLKDKVKNLSDAEIKVELAKVIAAIGDAHTRFVFDTSLVYPFKTYWFEDGIYIINTTEDYKSAMNSKLLSINGQNINDIVEKIKTVIPHENEAQLKSSLNKYISSPEVLKGLNITNIDEADMVFQDNLGKVVKLKVKSEDSSKVKLIGGHEQNDELPLYRRNAKEYYWCEYLDKYNTVYFKYNSCMDMEEKNFKDFNTELFALIDQKKPDMLVIDLRDNSGGSSPLFAPFLSELQKREYLNDSKKLFVIIGRQTFSSAIINACDIKNSTKATFVGEPTGGKPNHYGEVKKLLLPNNNITISYSTKYIRTIKTEEMDTLNPDILIYPNLMDYINNKDTVMDTILKW